MVKKGASNLTSTESIYLGLIIVSEVLIGFIVYFKGGTTFSLTHLMYIPIIIAGAIFDIKGSVETAILGGLILGPLMPLNVSEGLMQDMSSWIFRLLLFLLIGLLAGYLFQRCKTFNKLQISKSYIYEMTGFANARKLKNDINEMICTQNSFSIMVFKITNMDQINRYIDYSIGEKSLLKALEIMANLVNQDTIYSIYIDEFAVAMWGCDIDDTTLKAIEFINYFKEPILIDGIPVNIAMQGGISNYPLHGNDVFKNMGRSLDQATYGANKIAVYERKKACECQAKFETVTSLYEAINNDQFSIVYQPIFNLRSNEIESVEALLRWNNSKGLKPDEFIKIAEDADIISEISRWVIKHVIDQLKEWQAEGIKTKVAINISSNDLKNDLILNYTIDYLAKCEIESSQLIFELTERIMFDNTHELKDKLNRIKDIGIQISLDDFGTGYNSLVQFVSLPIDDLKIDKAFIDNLQDVHYHSLIEGLIIMAHNLGQKVIAEGVETELQMEQLRTMGCDYIQGYYLSVPLDPALLKQQYLQKAPEY